MKTYKNKRTGRVVTVNGLLTGKNWELAKETRQQVGAGGETETAAASAAQKNGSAKKTAGTSAKKGAGTAVKKTTGGAAKKTSGGAAKTTAKPNAGSNEGVS